MAPKQSKPVKKEMTPEAKARAKAKAMAVAYVSNPVAAAPFQGTSEEFVAQMVATEDVLATVSLSSSQTIQDALPIIQRLAEKHQTTMIVFETVLSERTKATTSLQKKAEKQVEQDEQRVAIARQKGRHIIVTMFMGEYRFTFTVPLTMNVGPLRDLFTGQFNLTPGVEKIPSVLTRSLRMHVEGTDIDLATNPRKSLWFMGIRDDITVAMSYPVVPQDDNDDDDNAEGEDDPEEQGDVNEEQ